MLRSGWIEDIVSKLYHHSLTSSVIQNFFSEIIIGKRNRAISHTSEKTIIALSVFLVAKPRRRRGELNFMKPSS